MAEKGIVFVVGAGPGLAGLLTVRGKELLARADAVVYERRSQRKLIPGGLSGGPETYYVGPRGKVRRAPHFPAGADIVRLRTTRESARYQLALTASFVHDCVCAREQLLASDREETSQTWPGADYKDDSFLRHLRLLHHRLTAYPP